MKCSFPLRFFITSLFLSSILALFSSESVLGQAIDSPESPAMETPYEAYLFVPTDSFPDFAAVKTVAYNYVDCFDKIGDSFPNCSFYDVPEVTGVALSDHLLTWGELEQCLNSAKTLSTHPLWTCEMESYIKRRIVSRQLLGSPSSTNEFFYEVVPEHANETALLSATEAQRVVNWRNVHYWLYHQLKQEDVLLSGKSITQEPDDHLTTYFRGEGIYPPIGYSLNGDYIDHIDEILYQSAEVGCFYFSKNGDVVEKIDSQAIFSLPTTAQKKSWDSQYTIQFPLQEPIWTTESLHDSATSTEKRAVQLAVNKDIMMQHEGAEAEESSLKKRVQMAKQGFVLLKSSDGYQQANQNEKNMLERTFWNVAGVLSLGFAWGDIAAVLKATSELRFCLETTHYAPVLSLIEEGGFTSEDCIAANVILRDKREVRLTTEEITSITQRSGYTCLNNDQYEALAEAYRNKFNGQWQRGWGEICFSFFCFEFGNSSNINCNY